MSDGHPIAIRLATEADAAPLSQLALRSKAHWGYAADLLATWAEELRVRPESCRAGDVWVAEIGQHIVGFAEVDQRDDGLWLDGLWIDPGWMRQGIGRRLFETVLDAARSRGQQSLLAEVEPHAIGFYMRMGAVEIGANPSSIIPGRLLPVMQIDVSPINSDPGRLSV